MQLPTATNRTSQTRHTHGAWPERLVEGYQRQGIKGSTSAEGSRMLRQIAAPAAPAPLAAEADDLMPHLNLTRRVGIHPLQNCLQMLWVRVGKCYFSRCCAGKDRMSALCCVHDGS
jgi:hypothetical protein